MNDHSLTETTQALSVSELNRRARSLLEQGLGRAWVAGEISNLARPASGHLYFSLKDAAAQLRCAWFRQRRRGPVPTIRDGDQVLVLGRVSIYEARGDFQLIVEQLEPAGEGALRQQFEALKKRLAAEGLFDSERKRDLPVLPRRIGVITSPTGAAIRDILTVLRRRFPAIPVTLYPAAVQGTGAAAELVAALGAAARRAECDVLIIGRGGGSLEDLWPFNDEALARAIVASPIPVVSAVGHEVDITISDFVADRRAPTPSGAAELVVPDQAEWQRAFAAHAARLATQMRRHLRNNAQALDWLGRRLQQCSPAARLRQQHARLLELVRALAAAMRLDFERRGRAVDALRARVQARSPAGRIERAAQRQRELERRLGRAVRDLLQAARGRLQMAERSLHAVSPLATLDRGYAIVTDAASGRVLTDAAAARAGDTIRARLGRGALLATVTGTDTGEDR